MLSKFADECKENYENDKSTNVLLSCPQNRYASLSAANFMPYANHVHAHETLQAALGLRSLPPRCPVNFAQTKAMLGYDPHNLDAVESILPHLSPTVLRERISLLLVSKNQPPLLNPRPGCEFSLAYIVYCALHFDPQNVSLWSSRDVRLDHCAENSAILALWHLKAQAQEALLKLGYDHSPTMRKRAGMIWHSHLDVLRYRSYHSKNPLQRWATLADKAAKQISTNITALCSLAWPVYCLRTEKPCDKGKFKALFEQAAAVGFALDPFSSELTEGDFKKFQIEQHWAKYQHFLSLKGSYQHLVEHSFYTMTPMAKLNNDVLEKYKVPDFEVLFNAVKVNLPLTPADANKEAKKNPGCYLVGLRLKKRRQRMVDQSYSDDEVDWDAPRKKKAVVKKKKTAFSTKGCAGDSDFESLAETDISPQKRHVDPQEVLCFGRKNRGDMLNEMDTSSISSFSREMMMAEEME